MATTVPETFKGTPKLSARKVKIITEWYHSALGNSDKATDVIDVAYATGRATALQDVLELLVSKEKRNHHLLGITAIAGFSYLAYRLYQMDEEKTNGTTTT